MPVCTRPPDRFFASLARYGRIRFSKEPVMHPCEPIVVEPARADEFDAAFALVFSRYPQATREAQRKAAQTSGVQPGFANQVWVARAGGSIYAAAIGQTQPGRIAVVWPVGVAARDLTGCVPEQAEASAVAVSVLERLCRSLAESGIVLAQTMLSDCDEDSPRLLQSAGFTHLADLEYLLWDTSPAPPPSPALRFERCDDPFSPRLARMVEASYDQTLDCPMLGGLRDTADVLAGYAASGTRETRRWFIVIEQGRDIGCLLLQNHRPEAVCELVYMGLAPEARGRRRGLEIVRFAQTASVESGQTHLALAVDAANLPARAMYRETGFFPWDSRRVFVRPLSAARNVRAD